MKNQVSNFQLQHCQVCDGELRKIGEKLDTEITQCVFCGSIVSMCDEPSTDFYEDGYFEDEIYGYKDENRSTTNILKMDAAITRRLSFLRNTSIILEIGAGAGSFVKAALNQGLNIEGIERSARMRAIAKRSHNIDLLSEIPFNVTDQVSIVLVEVIEHIKFPKQFLKNIFASIGKKPDKILITTPNAEAYDILGLNWIQIKPPEHLILYTFSGLSNLLGFLGYKKIKFVYYHSIFLAYSIEKFGSRSNRRIPLLWCFSSFLRYFDAYICKILPAKYSMGLECYCEN